VGISEQDSSIKVLNQLQRETENLSELYELIKVLSSDLLQDVHWAQIKQIVGSENINLKKMNLSGVIALDLRSATP
jgi:predicted thioredoxin/glutaredoxin